MKKFFSILVLLTVLVGGAFVGRNVGMNFRALFTKDVIVEEKWCLPDGWNKKQPDKHYHVVYKVHKNYSPRLFWLKLNKVDTLSSKIILVD